MNTNIEITTTPAAEIVIGDLLLDYDGHGEDAGEAGTYDESALDDLISTLRDLITLPRGWELVTCHEGDGCRLIAFRRDGATATSHKELIAFDDRCPMRDD